MWFVRARDRRFVEVNDAACRRYGYSREEFLHKLVLDDVRVKKWRETRGPISAERHIESATFESQHRAKNGETFPVCVRSHLQVIDGERVGFAVITDLTDQKEGDRILNLYHLLAQHTQEAIWFMRVKDERFIDVNASACRLYGYTREEFRNLALSDIVVTRHSLNYVPSASSSLGFAAFESLHRRRDGTQFPVSVHAERAMLDDELINVVVIGDLTERKRQEEEIERARDAAIDAVQMKSRFVATMSHEIRTPMNAIVGIAEMLPRAGAADQPRLFQLLGVAANSLLTLVNDILDISKLEAGEMEFSNEPFSIADVVASSLATIEYQAKSKGLTIEASVDPAIPPIVRGDACRLTQVLVNLLGNAVKFTDRGGVTVKAELLAGDEGVCRMRFAIKDTGIGIPREQQERIFRAFVQVDDSLSRRVQGTGLGLSICAHFVDVMRGEIGVDSEPGAGSTFWFTASFELERRAGRFALPPAGEDRRHGSIRKRGTVLVAEDNEISRQVIEMQLGELGYEATIVPDGFAAIAAAAQGEYTVILMDWQMPGLDGVAAAKEIRARGLQRVPIIAMTANALDEQLLVEYGFDGSLPKPVTLSALRAVCEGSPRP